MMKKIACTLFLTVGIFACKDNVKNDQAAREPQKVIATNGCQCSSQPATTCMDVNSITLDPNVKDVPCPKDVNPAHCRDGKLTDEGRRAMCAVAFGLLPASTTPSGR